MILAYINTVNTFFAQINWSKTEMFSVRLPKIIQTNATGTSNVQIPIMKAVWPTKVDNHSGSIRDFAMVLFPVKKLFA